MKAENIPLTYGGKAKFMIQNVLAAVLAAHVHGISIEDMKAGLETFIPSATQTPGRLNLFEFNHFHYSFRLCAQSSRNASTSKIC